MTATPVALVDVYNGEHGLLPFPQEGTGDPSKDPSNTPTTHFDTVLLEALKSLF